MSYVVFTFMLIGILQIVGVAKHWVYVLLYAMLGIAGCTAWPSCLSVRLLLFVDCLAILPAKRKWF
jgi:hypothetical protein